MNEQYIKARFQQKHDIESNWIATNFIPYDGEIVVYDINESNSKPRIKIGNGKDDINVLPFIASGVDFVAGQNVEIVKNEDGTYTINAIDTWKPNTATDEGYVAAGSGNINKVWKTDADGVPAWRDDENTDTTYSASNGIEIAENVIKHTNSVEAGTTVKPGEGNVIGYGETFSVPQISYDNEGHITNVSSTSFTMPDKGEYVLPEATENALGGIKVGYVSNGDREYPVILADGKAYVEVPWVDTDTHQNAFSKVSMVKDGNTSSIEANNPTDSVVIEIGSGLAASTNIAGDRFVLNADVNRDYVDNAIANLVDNSSEAVDSINELAAAMKINKDAIDALNTIASNKASKDHTHNVSVVGTNSTSDVTGAVEIPNIKTENNYLKLKTSSSSVLSEDTAFDFTANFEKVELKQISLM